MVLKQSKLSRNTGNSFYSFCYKHHTNRHGCIAKFLLNNDFTDEEKKSVAQVVSHIVEDGGLSVNWEICTQNCELYSLNKHKRWLLADLIKTAIDNGDLIHENFRVVLHERSLPQQQPVQNMVWDRLKMKMLDTVSYHDSRTKIHHSYAKSGKLTSLSDLRMNCLQYNATSSKQHLPPPHHRHTRGVQRLQHIPWCERFDAENTPCTIDLLSGAFPYDDSVPEIRYEVWYSRPKLKCNEGIYTQSYRPWNPIKVYHKQTSCKFCRKHSSPLIWKKSGMKNKSWARFYFQGITHREGKEFMQGLLQEEELLEKEVQTIGEEISQLMRETELADSQNEDYAPYLYDREKQRPCYLADYIHERHENAKNVLSNFSKGKVKKRKKKQKNPSDDDSKKYPRKAMVICCGNGSTQSIKDKGETDTSAEEFGNNIPERDKLFASKGIVSKIIRTSSLCTGPLRDAIFICNMYSSSVGDFVRKYPQRCKITESCRPRRYAVTFGKESISHLLLWKKGRMLENNIFASQYWLRIHRECSKEDVNSLQHLLSAAFVSTRVYTLPEILHLAENVTSQLQSTVRPSCSPAGNLSAGVYEKVCGIQCDVLSVNEAYQKLESQENMVDSLETASDKLPVSPQQPMFDCCDICYCSLQDPLAQGTLLLPCQHFFCNECWKMYITNRIQEGCRRITCPAYNCDGVLEEVSIMSFVPCDIYNQWLMRKKEFSIESSQIWKWCPNAKCQKVARVVKQGICGDKSCVPVNCNCGTSWCFSCLKDRHWPASCQQRDVYTKMLKQNGDEYGQAPPQATTYFVDVKKCPKCGYPMQKNGGCQHMNCRCGYGFCWICGGDWTAHMHNGLTCNKGRVHSEITIALDNTKSYPVPIRFYKTSVEHRYKWLKSLSLHVLEARCRRYAFKMQKNKMKSDSSGNVSGNMMDMEAYSNLLHILKVLRELHEILENVYVVMSHTTKKTKCLLMQRWIDHLEFCTSRLETILLEDDIVATDDVIQRCSRLETAIYKILRQIATRVPDLQNDISSSSRQVILDRPISELGHYV